MFCWRDLARLLCHDVKADLDDSKSVHHVTYHLPPPIPACVECKRKSCNPRLPHCSPVPCCGPHLVLAPVVCVHTRVTGGIGGGIDFAEDRNNGGGVSLRRGLPRGGETVSVSGENAPSVRTGKLCAAALFVFYNFETTHSREEKQDGLGGGRRT